MSSLWGKCGPASCRHPPSEASQGSVTPWCQSGQDSQVGFQPSFWTWKRFSHWKTLLGKLIVYTEPTHRLEALNDLIQVSAECSASTRNQPVFPAFPPADRTNQQETTTEERRDGWERPQRAWGSLTAPSRHGGTLTVGHQHGGGDRCSTKSCSLSLLSPPPGELASALSLFPSFLELLGGSTP